MLQDLEKESLLNQSTERRILVADSRSASGINDYSKVAFSAGGVKQDISLEEWKAGWATIVGGLNGKPTAQQFNMTMFILSSLINSAIEDISSVTGTANDALPKSNFNAGNIVQMLAAYGLLQGCNADKLDGKDASAFAASSHNHSASEIVSGTLPISRGGTGSTNAYDACTSLGAMRTAGGTFAGTVYFANGSSHYVASTGDAHFKSLAVSGDISAQRVYDAVYNDYAELMPRGEDTEPGDIIALDTSSQTERYIKATNLSNRIAGIHTDEYAMLIGGNKVAEGQDFLEENLPSFIPVSLAGRVHAKVVGPVHTGDYIVLSSTPGVGRAIAPCESYPANKIVGYACEGDDRTDLRLVKVRVGGA